MNTDLENLRRFAMSIGLVLIVFGSVRAGPSQSEPRDIPRLRGPL